MAIQYRSIFFLFRLNNERHFCVVQISGVLSIFQVFHSGIYDFKLRIYSEFEMSEINGPAIWVLIVYYNRHAHIRRSDGYNEHSIGVIT